MHRRDLLTLSAALAAFAVLPAPAGAAGMAASLPAADWRRFADRFIGSEGRVSDSGNGGISHSEGQGYAMLLALAADDRAAFDRLWAWTEANLLRGRDDGLLAWKWEPGKGVTDRNNATDGDILTGWALLRSAEQWGNEGHRRAALSMLQAVRRHLVVEHGGMTLLLPGATGFRQDNGVVVNPSYWIFPALAAFAAADADGKPVWEKVSGSGLVLIAKARFGQWQLPPDWVRIEADGTAVLPERFKQQFGYDAIRVPLYMAWGGYRDPYYFRPYGAFLARFNGGPIPATVSLPGGTTAQVPASVGMLAVYRMAARIAATGAAVTVPPPGADEDYYSSVLALLTQLAERSLGLTQ
ncbi:glycosyl hydrolase family 8 [Azospirillum sp. SYSU D00513]|uniref:glycosyl hydrolase family 8 n=1 Tax=Azospirillum sp. SYSU D00513 TaxID=2812561 RepID=UPI001A965F30|nr:glycosyl hydrolase family 8 [Azospirillum sp. SYSU D00513]